MGNKASALLLGATVLLAGCSVGQDVVATGPTAPLPSASVRTGPSQVASGTAEPTTSATLRDEEAEVLAAYRAFYAALDAAQADPQNSQQYLEPVATGVQLEQANGAIKANFLAGEESVGAPVLRPKVHSIVDESAVVRDCQDTTGVVRRDIDSQEPLIIGQDPDSIETTMSRIDGVWRVAETAFPDDPGAFC